jgi:hypothetical protein
MIACCFSCCRLNVLLLVGAAKISLCSMFTHIWRKTPYPTILAVYRKSEHNWSSNGIHQLSPILRMTSLQNICTSSLQCENWFSS